MICFPVIRSIDIKGFQIYKNENNDGISHELNGGIHLIIGVNGLGKTTLLSALFRLLVGPKDIPKSDTALLGSTGHTLAQWRKNSFFRNRVKDGAINSFIKCKVSFGDNILEIERKLSNLEVVGLSKNGVILEASQDEYERQIIELSGAADYVDFYYIIKYLLFFLEDRTELIWDNRAQFEMMRILFFDAESSREAVKQYDIAQKADSKYRNLNASLTTIRDRLKEKSDAESEKNRATYILEKTKLSALEEAFKESQDNYINQKNILEDERLAKATYSRDLDELKYAIDYNQHLIYGHYLPDNDATLEYILKSLNSGAGCLACGNESASPDYFRKKFSLDKRCPICNSQIEGKEKNDHSIEHLNNELKILYAKMDILEDSISSKTTIIEELKEGVYVIENILRDSMLELKASQNRVKNLEKNMPLDETEKQELQRIIDFREIELREQNNIRNEANAKYLNILTINNEKLNVKMKLLEQRFKYYSKNLLAERVFIRYETQSRKIGQGISAIDFPCFKVLMTSGVFDREPSKRETADSVSESQKEFIDLAFRLSLIDVISAENQSPAMVVMETPEASLDSLFIHEASRLFREFANAQDGKNIFLASTNLNKSEMIPALLGAISSPATYDKSDSDIILNKLGQETSIKTADGICRENRSKHIINLLNLAAPNLSLKNNWNEYNLMFSKAVYPEDYEDIADER
ncbi:hypothetical protein electrica_00691 [Klebsiella electrica]|uniref:AAA family ATPase n=1 Tax=Klebsiella electrica TaxID=1259973 RepID=UPI001150F972|nr:AAA family ATPase [Klebsiella electrica]QDI06920.1 hypothetical protein electrica_00691 [Klebsiella electrica]